MKPKTRKIVIIASAMLSMLLIGTALGAVLYTLTVSNQMRLTVAYGLELRRADGTTVISSYDWGDFGEGESKQMHSEVVQLWNTGNTPATITFDSDPAVKAQGWDLTIANATGTNLFLKDWASTSAYQRWTVYDLAPDTYIPLNITLTEVSATPDGGDSFNLIFDVIEEE